MADSTDHRSSGDSVQNQLKSELKYCRQLVVSLHSLLIWDNDYYPIVLSTIVSLVFFLIGYSETSLLTTLSLLAMVSTVIDYALPLIVHNFFDDSKWNDSKESQFEKICEDLSNSWTAIVDTYSDWKRTKASNPKMYYSVVLSTLLMMSWISNIVPNLLMTYLFVLFVVLFPGLKKRGIVDKYLSLVLSYVLKAKRY